MIGTQNIGLRTVYRRTSKLQICGSVHGEIFMNQRREKRIRSAWRPEFRRKVNIFDKNATKSDFESAPSDISAVPTHLGGSQGPVRDRKIRKKLKYPGLGHQRKLLGLRLLPRLYKNSRTQAVSPLADQNLMTLGSVLPPARPETRISRLSTRVTSPKGAKTRIF